MGPIHRASVWPRLVLFSPNSFIRRSSPEEQSPARAAERPDRLSEPNRPDTRISPVLFTTLKTALLANNQQASPAGEGSLLGPARLGRTRPAPSGDCPPRGSSPEQVFWVTDWAAGHPINR